MVSLLAFNQTDSQTFCNSMLITLSINSKQQVCIISKIALKMKAILRRITNIINSFCQEGKVTNSAILLVVYGVRIFFSLPTGTVTLT